MVSQLAGLLVMMRLYQRRAHCGHDTTLQWSHHPTTLCFSSSHYYALYAGPHRDGYGLGSMDAFDGYVAYLALDPKGVELGQVRDRFTCEPTSQMHVYSCVDVGSISISH